MATYTDITFEDMREFLKAQGFVDITATLTDVKEAVMARRAKSRHLPANITLSLRVYTSIASNGHARDCGADAIRVALFCKTPDHKIHKLSGSKRVHRVAGWRENLQSRIDDFSHDYKVVATCSRCQLPMARRRSRHGEFYGCMNYPACLETKPIEAEKGKRR